MTVDARLDSMQGLVRTHMCGMLSVQDVGHEAVLMGWVNRRRDHGGLIFVDLRDRSGLAQVVFSPDVDPAAFKLAEGIRNEFVLAVVGEVRLRPEGTENVNLSTGRVEVYARHLRVLNRALNPPFYIADQVDVDENVRLKYRYLDLRRPEMQQVLILRHRAVKAMRDFLDANGFLEIETPMLTRSTPEGARDYLVPSRVHPGKFYALPQSPQIFKQILMVSGLDRYFQVVRCFRDEDLRSDRQPEFTQLDIEMSFMGRDAILSLMEKLVAFIFQTTLGVELEIPFRRIPYSEAMARYGSDKPDLRFGMELVEVSDLVAGCGFQVFSSAVQQGGQVKAIRVPGCASYSRKDMEELTQLAGNFGAKGLAWMALTTEGLRSPIAKFFNEGELSALFHRMGAETGDLLLFVADKPVVVSNVLGRLRLEMANRLNLVNTGQYEFCWVTDFPLLEWDAEEGRYVAMHHPFTAPVEEDIELMNHDPGQVRAQAYDLVLNGTELGGGSVRIHRRDLQEKMFGLLGFSSEEARAKFGFLLDAFEYGTPPHGGIAFGVDRLIMLMSGRENIRDVIAFPKTQSAVDPMVDAPSAVSPKQLKELHLRTEVVAAKV